MDHAQEVQESFAASLVGVSDLAQHKSGIPGGNQDAAQPKTKE